MAAPRHAKCPGSVSRLCAVVCCRVLWCVALCGGVCVCDRVLVVWGSMWWWWCVVLVLQASGLAGCVPP